MPDAIGVLPLANGSRAKIRTSARAQNHAMRYEWMDKNPISVWNSSAAARAGISQHIGWHSFRRTLATLLQYNGEMVKTTQDMLRHATSRLTLELYDRGHHAREAIG